MPELSIRSLLYDVWDRVSGLDHNISIKCIKGDLKLILPTLDVDVSVTPNVPIHPDHPLYQCRVSLDNYTLVTIDTVAQLIQQRVQLIKDLY